MKLAILGTRGIPARYGGFESFADHISVLLAEAGIDVTVYCPRGSGTATQYHGVSLEYVSNPKLGPATTILYDLACLWRARKGFDVVYMLGYGSALFCWLPRLSASSVWINMDGLEWKRSKWSALAKFWLKSMEGIATRTATRLIVDAEEIGHDLRSRYPKSAPQTYIAYGAELQSIGHGQVRLVLDDLGLQSQAYFMVVARLEPENHVLEIVEGFIKSGARSPLIVVGDIATGTEYVGRLLGLQAGNSNVRFVGSIYDRAKLDCLRIGALGYFHGHSVGGTNPALLEAMACGCFIVCHDNPFNREVADDAAVYFRSVHDVAEATNRISRMEPSALTAYKQRARERVRSRYSWERIRDRYLELLEEG